MKVKLFVGTVLMPLLVIACLVYSPCSVVEPIPAPPDLRDLHFRKGGGNVTGLYLVKFADPLLAAYKGGVKGLAPTSPSVTGENRLNVAFRPAGPTCGILPKSEKVFCKKWVGPFPSS